MTPTVTNPTADPLDIEAYDPMAGTLQGLASARGKQAYGHAAPHECLSPGRGGSEAAPGQDVNVCILALDLGNKTGWALRRRDGSIAHGTQDFTPRASWTPGQRWQRFRSWLAETITQHQVHGLVYERVVFGHSSAGASDVYGGYKALVEMAADSHGLTLASVAVPTVKKHWTGSGRVDKDTMMAQAKTRGYRPDTHNSADALAILDWAVAQERAS